MIVTTTALPALLDPMYWLGGDGPFGAAVLPTVLVVVLVETGLLFPFLPGDTLLFTAGLLAAQRDAPVSLAAVAPSAAAAAVLGGQIGYLIGRRVGPAIFSRTDSRVFNRRHLDASREFFARHGRKTLVIGHFVGVVRTFTPVIAGASRMRYPVFLAYDVLGATLWTVGLTVAGHQLGHVRAVGDNLELAVAVIAVLSTVPVAVSVARALIARRRAARGAVSVQAPASEPANP